MPKRLKTLKVATPEAQGPDSWVEFVPLLLNEIIGDDFVPPTKDEIAKRIVGWNWVNDDGQPLPAPKDDPTVMDALTTYEFVCLRDVIWGWQDKERLKN